MPEPDSTISHHGFHCDPEIDVCYRTLDFLGFPGYRVGDDGSVWSRLKIIHHGPGTAHSVIGTTWKPLGFDSGHLGHRRTWLYPDGKKVLIHHLVLLAFDGKSHPKMECRHLDGDPTNNRLGNLKWGTRKENAADRNRHNRTARGERSGMAKLTDELVMAIINDPDQSYGNRTRLSKKYGVSITIISGILRGESWKHINRQSLH